MQAPPPVQKLADAAPPTKPLDLNSVSIDEVHDLVGGVAERMHANEPDSSGILNELITELGFSEEAPGGEDPAQAGQPAADGQEAATPEVAEAIEDEPEAPEPLDATAILAELARQQKEMLEQLRPQQRQQTQTRTPPADELTYEQIDDLMTRSGWPINETTIVAFKDRWDRLIENKQTSERLARLEQQNQALYEQAAALQARAAIVPRVQRTLAPYGELDAETTEAITNAAVYWRSQGADEKAAIAEAVKPYKALLSKIAELRKTSPKPAPKPNAPPARPKPSEQMLKAAAMSGQATGHGRSLKDIPIDELESRLFSAN